MNLGIQHKTQTINPNNYSLMSPVSPVCHTEVTVNKINSLTLLRQSVFLFWEQDRVNTEFQTEVRSLSKT